MPQSDLMLTDAAGKDFYLLVSVKGKEKSGTTARPPLNISLVLDRSGSMQGDKILYAKKAVDFVVDNLNSSDVLSIVNYDDVVEVTAASAPIINKSVLHEKIARINSRGSTNLTGGMLEGYNQALQTKKSGFVNRVLLLSDGLANVGITDPTQIQQIAQKKLREEGIGISTFGVGADFNEDLMTNIAEYGGGNYHFIGSPDQIPGIFAKELQGLLQVVAQNAMVTLHFPSEKLECKKVYGYPYQVKGDDVTINLNDVFADEEKTLLLKFSTRQKIAEPIQFTTALKYTDATTFNTKNISSTNNIATTNNAAETSLLRKPVVEHVALFQSAELFDEAIMENDKGNYDVARRKTGILNTYLDSLNAKGISSPKIEKQKESVVKYMNAAKDFESKSVVEQKMIQKDLKSLNYEVKKGR